MSEAAHKRIELVANFARGEFPDPPSPFSSFDFLSLLDFFGFFFGVTGASCLSFWSPPALDGVAFGLECKKGHFFP